ncbi:MAG: hypothetical protein ABW328_16655 [Ilumatobacteraceae bacterium]
MTRSHGWLVRTLLVLGAVLAALGLVAGHANRTVLDGPTFVDDVEAVRRDDAVSTQVGLAIATELIASNPDLVALAPLVQAVSIRVAGGELLERPTRRAASTVHTALTEEDADSVVLRIVDLGAVVSGVLGAVAPDRAPAASDVSVTLASIGSQSFASTTLLVTRIVGLLAWLLPALALVCLLGAVFASPDRWRAAVSAGWALVWAAGAVGLVLVVGGFLVRRLDTDTLGGAVGQASWRVFVRPLWWGVLALATVGVATVITCGSAVPGTLRARTARARAVLVRRPTSTLGVVVRAVVIGLVGLAAISDPIGMVELTVFVVGIGLTLFALAEVAAFADAARARRPVLAAEPASGRAGTRPAVWIALGAVGGLAVIGVFALARPAQDADAVVDPAADQRCNGHVELCDRTFDDVAYVASHNAMSVAREPGWFLAEQLDPIPEQLDQGVRALLVDVWSGRSAASVVRTAPSSYAEALAVTEAELGPDVVAAAARIAESVAGVPEGPEARHMCHGLCETGSTPFLETLQQLRNWLAANPDEVVTLFIEDHVDSSLIASDVESAGLVPYIHQPVAGAPWPTLGEMVASGQRLVVMVEEGGDVPDAPWLVNGFEFTQDTPYTFPTVESFSCDPNRGRPDAPLFLLNHWLSGFSALVTDAQHINTAEVLLARAERCRDERGQIPNFVAVNFVVFGDVQAVVDTLNGVT